MLDKTWLPTLQKAWIVRPICKVDFQRGQVTFLIGLSLDQLDDGTNLQINI